MTDFETKLDKLAALAVHVGLNLRAGQEVVMTAPIGQPVVLASRKLEPSESTYSQREATVGRTRQTFVTGSSHCRKL